MPVTDILANISLGLNLGLSILSFDVLLSLIAGGWVTILRSIGFFIDKTLISIISKCFEYFELIISKELFAPSLINQITKNVYFFIAIFVLFKLAVRFMKYIMEPNLVSDENIGTNAIIKRTIVGLSLIIFIPTIFGLIRDFQKAIIADDVINKVIMDTNTQIKYEEVKMRAPVGRIVGYSVLRGFLNYDDDKFAASLVEKQWNTAETNFDPSSISINSGGVGYSDNYYYDYIPIISTIALGYVAFLIIKYCFDVLVRFFKLMILQIISPIVMVDYIFDGGQQGSFKQWLTTVISTFAMLFIRIISLSFVIMVCIHMQMTRQECLDKYVNNNGTEEVANNDRIACENSLLYIDEDGEVDNLLRAGVIIALLAFCMDLPKIFSHIFGLDLEQESSVTGMVQKVGGIGKMVGIAGLSFAGGLLGGAVGGIKGAVSTGANWSAKNRAINAEKAALTNRYKSGEIGKNEYDKGMENLNKASTKNNYRSSQQLAAASKGMALGGIMAAASKTQVGGAVVGSYQSSKQSSMGGAKDSGIVGSIYDAQDAQSEKEKQELQEQSLKDYRQHQMQVSDKQLEQQQIINMKLGVNPNVDSVDVVSKAAGIRDFSKGETILGNLKNLNQTAEATRENVVEINDETRVIRRNSDDSLIQGAGINQKLGDINTTSQITAEHTVNIDNKMDNVVNTTNDINRNVQTAVNTTQTIAENTDTMVIQNNNIMHKVDQIEDNTFYSGIDSIDNMESKGLVDNVIDKLIDSDADTTPKDNTNNNSSNNKDDIETL